MSLLRTAAARSIAPRLMTRAASTSSIHVVSSRNNESAPLLANIEASWAKLPASEQYQVYQELEQIQKKDWKELTTDEKKAGECAISRSGDEAFSCERGSRCGIRASCRAAACNDRHADARGESAVVGLLFSSHRAIFLLARRVASDQRV